MIAEYDRVVLMHDLPREGLKAGDVGTVMHIYSEGKGYEVEFMALNGDTIAVVTLKAEEVRPVGPNDISHVRVAESIAA